MYRTTVQSALGWGVIARTWNWRHRGVRERFRTACKPLIIERLRHLTFQHGRHTFISHALAGERSLAEVKAAAGHSVLTTTSV